MSSLFPIKTPLSEVFVVGVGARVKSPLGWFLGGGGKRRESLSCYCHNALACISLSDGAR